MPDAPDTPTIAYVAIGSNLGDRRAAIAAATAALGRVPGVRFLRVSAIRETAPVGCPPGSLPFLNGAAELAVTLPPGELLAALHTIEAALGRIRADDDLPAHRNAPRTMDLDLLLYGDSVLDEPGLVVPHPRMATRRFVLEPLCDLAPGLVHPVLGVPLRDLLARL
jgi:2-amino-4-hydroxy-6-hydroxymethyldihydropteridine diphosphokinase